MYAARRTTTDTLSSLRQFQQDLDEKLSALLANGHYLSSGQQTQLAQLCAMHSMLERSARAAACDQRRGRSQLFDEVCSGPHLSENRVHEGEVPYGSPHAPDARDDRSRCSAHCRCRCHRISSLRPIPSWLSPWIGALYIPRTLLASLWSTFDACTDRSCQRGRAGLMTVKYFLPAWFARLEASIRFEALPVQFCIQTPRVVESLDFLDGAGIGLDDLKRMLATRRVTLHDTEPSGFPLVHVSTIYLWIAL